MDDDRQPRWNDGTQLPRMPAGTSIQVRLYDARVSIRGVLSRVTPTRLYFVDGRSFHLGAVTKWRVAPRLRANDFILRVGVDVADWRGIVIDVTPDGVQVETKDGVEVWPAADLERADDRARMTTHSARRAALG